MDGDGPRELEVVEVVFFVGDGAAFVADGDGVVLGVELGDEADVSVEDFEFVVVSGLHDFFAEVEACASDGDEGLVCAEFLLHFLVDRGAAEFAAVCGCEDLDISHGV